MPIATVLLISLFLLCCTRCLDGLFSRFGFQPGHAAAFSILLLAAAAFDFELGAGFSLHPAALLLLAVTAFSARREKAAYSLPLAAFGAGVLGWLIVRSVPDAVEPGLLMALPAALMARALYRAPRAGLCLTALAPLFHALMTMLEDWYLFGFASLPCGSPLQFDAQLCGAGLYALLLFLPRSVRIQKSFKKRLDFLA